METERGGGTGEGLSRGVGDQRVCEEYEGERTGERERGRGEGGGE